VKIRLKKKADDRPVVSVTRADGSATSGQLGAGSFGPVHDLAHYAVETQLGATQGFYGLLARGWNIPDFAVRGAAARFPDEAIVVECLVGQLAPVVFSAQPMTAAEFNWLAGTAVAAVRPQAEAPRFDDAGFARLRTTLLDLVARWHELPVGGTLELDFPVTPAAAP
jgi:hypothetical protein